MDFSCCRRAAVAGVLASICGMTLAAGHIEVNAWAAATPPGADVGVAYLEIHNLGTTPDRLLGVQSPAAKTLSLHESMAMGGMVHMRALDGLAIAPGAVIRFAPGGEHVMLENLNRPLKVGDSLTLTLNFEHAGSLTVNAPVREIGVAQVDRH